MKDNDFSQLNLFNEGREYKKFDPNKKLLLLEFFSGMGATAQGLKNIGIPFTHLHTCEWCSFSIKAYNLIHIRDFTDYSKGKTKEELIDYLDGNISTDWNQLCNVKKKPESWLRETYNNCIATHNLMNISNVHGEDLQIPVSEEYETFCSYSFPCQDISLAGKQASLEEGSGTRSSLLFEFLRILEELDQLYKEGKSGRITYLLMENVPEIISKKHIKHYHKFEERLAKLGYTSFGGVLNAKNYKIPQNRRRYFLLSILGDYSYDFPTKKPLDYWLKDLLEKNVDKKYYLSKKMIKFFTENTKKQNDSGNGRELKPISANNDETIAKTITTRAGSRMDDNFIDESTLKIKNATKQGYLEAEEGDAVDISGRMKYHRGTVQKGISQTLTTAGGGEHRSSN